MLNKKIILVLIIIISVIIGVSIIYTSHNLNDEISNNNVTKNNTVNNTNVTNNTTQESHNYANGESSYVSRESDPKYGTDEYVEKWDKSQKNNDGWAYTHDQPVKTGADGDSYKRVYHEDTGKSSWESMSPKN